MSKLKSGINTYEVKIIRMKDFNADSILQKAQRKAQEGDMLSKRDLSLVALSPLMEGDSTIKKRIMDGLKLVQNTLAETDTDETEKLQAVLYAIADKFLGKKELSDIKEVIKMTLLGQMLREDGLKEGETKNMILLVCKKLKKKQDYKTIADALETKEDYIRQICEIAQKHAPDYDVDVIYKELKK